ncbi:MAG: hypothetical protein QXS74_09480 [Nitrososphaeria archaeon]
MATTFNRYDGPSLNLPEVLACIVFLQGKNGGEGPTIDEIVEEIHRSDYAGLDREWVKSGVERALKIGLKKGYIERKDENGVTRYYTERLKQWYKR